MYSNIWTVKARIAGDFCLTQNQQLSAKLIPGIHRLKLFPETDTQDRPTGVHGIELELLVPLKDGTVSPTDVLDAAKEALACIAARIAVSSGRMVDVSENITIIQFSENDSNRGRAIQSATAVQIAPPSPVSAEFVASGSEPYLERAMYWWAHSLRIADPADSLHALFVALDLVAARLAPPTSRERRCKSCGATEVLQPGLKEKITHLLTVHGKLSLALAEEIYDTRNALTHGGITVNEEKKRALRGYANDLRRVVRDEIASRMNCMVPPLQVFPFDRHSAHLVLEFDNRQPSVPKSVD